MGENEQVAPKDGLKTISTEVEYEEILSELLVCFYSQCASTVLRHMDKRWDTGCRCQLLVTGLCCFSEQPRKLLLNP